MEDMDAIVPTMSGVAPKIIASGDIRGATNMNARKKKNVERCKNQMSLLSILSNPDIRLFHLLI